MPAATLKRRLNVWAMSSDGETFAQATSRAWAGFARQIQFDARLWLLGIVLLQFFRAVLLLSFRHRIAETSGLMDIATAFVVGLRFDVQAAAWFAAPSFLLSVA